MLVCFFNNFISCFYIMCIFWVEVGKMKQRIMFERIVKDKDIGKLIPKDMGIFLKVEEGDSIEIRGDVTKEGRIITIRKLGEPELEHPYWG